MKGETIGLSNIVELFNGNKGVRGIRPHFFFLIEGVHSMKGGMYFDYSIPSGNLQ